MNRRPDQSPTTGMETTVEPNLAALAWAATVRPPNLSSCGLLVHLAGRCDEQDFSTPVSLKLLARSLNCSTTTVSNALRSLVKADLVVTEDLPTVGGAYEAGRGQLVRLNHPDAPHMTPEQQAQRQAYRDHLERLRASMTRSPRPPQRAEEEETNDQAELPLVTTHEKGGLRLLAAPPPANPTTAPSYEQRRAAL